MTQPSSPRRTSASVKSSRNHGASPRERFYNYQQKIKPFFEQYQLRKLPKFTAVIRHCEKPFRKRLIPPINPDGTYPKWFTSFRPDYALCQWLKGKQPQAITSS